jgi:hypothetical protein
VCAIVILASGISVTAPTALGAATLDQTSSFKQPPALRNCPARPAAGPGTSAAQQRPELIVIQAPLEARGTLTGKYSHPSSMTHLPFGKQSPEILTADFFAAADPRISADGERVLFAGKKTENVPWQIWEMNVDGTSDRQVTKCPSDCVQPDYLAHGYITYTSLANDSRTKPPTSEGSQIWVCKLDGSEAHPITFGPGDFQLQTVLKSGWLLVSARSPLVPLNGRLSDRELYTMHLDGTALATLRCDHQHPAIRSQARELDDGSVVFVTSPLGAQGSGGQLAWIRRGAAHNEPLTTSPIVASSPQPLGGNDLLVSRETPSAPHKAPNSKVFAFDTASGKFGAAIYEAPDHATVEALPVAAHKPPQWYWSTLNPDLKRGYFICLDANRSQDAPHGRIAAALTQVRVLILDGATQKEQVLGKAPIEKDGSFYIAVPPDSPVRFEVLDAGGHVIREQESWIWARSGEEHGCVGCHEDHAIAPENRWPMALRRFDTPTRLDLSNLSAGTR